MIWFNIKKLEKIITEDRLTDKEAFDYLLIHLIFSVLTGFSTEEKPDWVEWIYLIVGLIAVIWGIRKTFEINRQGDNIDYFKRLISISFVVGIPLVVFIFSFFLVINIISEILDVTGSPLELSLFQKGLLESTGYVIVIIIYYYLMISSFKRITTRPPGSKIATA